MIGAAMLQTRREMDARMFRSRTAQRRASPYRDASWFELAIGLGSFVILVAGSLYLIAWLGR
jgi:hypothetical protein